MGGVGRWFASSMPTRPWFARDDLDVEIFDRDDWWAEEGFLYGLHTLLDPVRVPYFLSALDGLGPRPRILDVGCGGGFVSEALAAADCDVVGVDVASTNIRAAISRPHVATYLRADAHRLPFRSESFDGVVVSEVLEHVADPGRVLGEAARVLRPGGRVLFSGPNRTRLSRLVLIDLAQRRRLTRLLPAGLHRWEAFVGPRRLTELAAAAALEPVQITGVTLRVGDLLPAATALLALRGGRLSYGAAGRRIRLTAGGSPAIAYLATLVRR